MTFPQQFAPQPIQQFQQPPQFAPQQPAAPEWAQAQQGPVVPPPPEQGQQLDTSGFFGGGATISFDDKKGYVKGTPRGGLIISKSISAQTDLNTRKTKTWDNGEVRKQLVLVLQTNERADPQDDGRRQLFIKGGAVNAAKNAMRAAGANDLEIGGWYYQAWVDEDHTKKVGSNALKVYKAIYAKPGQPDPMAGQPAYTAPVPAMTPQNQNPAQPAQGGFPGNGPMGVMVPQPVAPTQFAPQMAPQPAAQGPIAAMPQQAMANFQQAAAQDPNVQAAIYGQATGQPMPQQQFQGMAGDPQFAQPPMAQSGPPNGVGSPQQDPAAQQTGQAPQWNPFGS